MIEKENNSNNIDNNEVLISYYDDNFLENAQTGQQIPVLSRTRAILKDIRDGMVFIQTDTNTIMLPIHRVLKIKKTLTQR